jgi:hypothetical protein
MGMFLGLASSCCDYYFSQRVEVRATFAAGFSGRANAIEA